MDGEPIRESVDDADDEEELITCWCGVTGTYDELFDDSGLSVGCNGTGHVYCECGGDLCVCHHHGQEVECPGCDECRDGDVFGPDDADDWDNGYPEDDE